MPQASSRRSSTLAKSKVLLKRRNLILALVVSEHCIRNSELHVYLLLFLVGRLCTSVCMHGDMSLSDVPV